MFSASKTSGPSGYNLTNSLRFRASASAFLNRTPASTGNRRTWTWSGWIKLGLDATSSDRMLFSGTTNGTTTIGTLFLDGGSSRLRYIDYTTSPASFQTNIITTSIYRDPSAWYHFVLAVDTTQATASNRFKFYVNGNQITSFDTAVYPSQNTDTFINAAQQHRLGSYPYNSPNFDGYMDEINFIDGQALTPSSFGSTNATTGVWQPARYTGTYGTNGFYLNFTDIGLTSGSNTGLGRDFSGNGNFFNTNNISVTAGVTYDAMTDVPTLTSPTQANYCVMNPLNSFSTITVNNANLQLTLNEAAYRKSIATMAFPTSGLYYLEGVVSGGIDYVSYGIVTPEAPLNNAVGSTATGYGAITGSTQWDRVNNGTQSGNFWNITTTNPTLQIAIDTTNGKLWLGYNNNWLDSSGGLTGNPSTGANATFTIDTARIYLPSFGGYKANSIVINTNFGQRPFVYTPPSGFVALNTFNLPNSTIVKGNTVMDATTYTGTGATQTITNAGGFYPDLIWIKSRSNATNNNLFTSVLSGSNILKSNSTDGVVGVTNAVTTFNSNGFTLGSDSGSIGVNINSNTYVAWQWLAGATSGTTSNTNGSITSFINVNTTAGFSQVYWTGTAANGTLGHGLGVAPRMIITKCRGASTDWAVYHASIGNTGALRLNLTAATETDSRYWNNTSPTSTVWSVGSSNASNAATAMVAYCWAQIPGFSAFGSYVGNGSSPGPFVYLGFRPEFIMAKSTSTNRNWIMFDATRSPFNTASARLFANTSGAESTNEQVLFLSNGFQMTTNTFDGNTNGETYIYMAFAENPFKNALAR